jgi:hypothetical protein
VGVGAELVAALTVVEDLDGALQTPGAEQVIDAGEAHDVACDVVGWAVLSR